MSPDGGGSYATVQEAVDGGGVVDLCPGTFYEDVVISDAVEIVGVEGAASTVLSAASGTALRVESGDVVVRGLTIFGGAGTGLHDGDGSGALGGGGAWVASGASLRLEDVVVEGGSGEFGGGLFAQGGSAVTVVGSRFRSNSAVAGGGLAALEGAVLVLSDSTVSENDAQTGGGMYLDGASLTATGSSVEANSADDGGGLYGLDIEIDGIVVYGNTSARGGGMVVGQAEVSNVVVDGNEATEEGGGVLLLGSYVAILRDCSVMYNIAPDGGGIASAGEMALVGGRILANEATTGSGGGVSAIGQLCSNAADWGIGEDDNTPKDLEYHNSARNDLGEAETFFCSGATWPCDTGVIPTWCE